MGTNLMAHQDERIFMQHVGRVIRWQLGGGAVLR